MHVSIQGVDAPIVPEGSRGKRDPSGTGVFGRGWVLGLNPPVAEPGYKFKNRNL